MRDRSRTCYIWAGSFGHAIWYEIHRGMWANAMTLAALSLLALIYAARCESIFVSELEDAKR